MSEAINGAAFLESKGRAVYFAVLSLRQQDQLAQFLRFSYMQETRAQMAGLSPEVAKYAIEKAKAQADRIYPGTKEHARHLFTFDGLAYALWLGAQKQDASFKLDEAQDLLESAGDEAIEVVRRCCGYEVVEIGEQPKDEPLAVAEIIRALCNEPYNHPPAVVWEMTLEDIAVIWTANKKNNKADHFASVAQWRAKRAKDDLGIWGRDSIWKSQSTASLSRLSA